VGTQLHFDCATISEPCRARTDKIEATVGLAGVGSLLGAGVGALIGRLSLMRQQHSARGDRTRSFDDTRVIAMMVDD
jgi:hypothetical protein